MENSVKRSRIWELDSLRGLFIICMVAVHTVYDLTDMFGMDFDPGFIYGLAKDYGAILFIVLSGICVTLGTRFLKRGLTVLCFGLAISLVMALLKNFVSDSFGYIYFGILHLLGLCMLMYPLFKRVPTAALAVLAAAFIALGFYINGIKLDGFAPLTVLGFRVKGVASVDHFPVFPNVGYFLAGIILGRTLYKEKKSLINENFGKNPVCRFFALCGRYSLHIYVLHQPIIYSALWVIFRFVK